MYEPRFTVCRRAGWPKRMNRVQVSLCFLQRHSQPTQLLILDCKLVYQLNSPNRDFDDATFRLSALRLSCSSFNLRGITRSKLKSGD
jgi:hypothetical protein